MTTPTSAFVITTSAGDFDVTTVPGSFNDNQATLTNQVWWGSQSLAVEFAGLVSNNLGLSSVGCCQFGPLFAFDVLTFGDPHVGVFRVGVEYVGAGSGVVQGPDGTFVKYAIASEITTNLPEPGTLGLMLMGLAGATLVRKRKQRIT